MKTKGLIYFAIAGFMLLASCSKEEMGPVISDNPVAPVLSGPSAGTNVEITADNFGEVLAFSWTAADYGFDAAVMYTVKAMMGEEVFEILKTNQLAGEITYEELNNKLLASGAIAGAVNSLEFWVEAYLSDAVAEIASAKVTLDLLPYYIEVVYPSLNIPGNYQGWDPGNMETVIHSLKSDEVYDGFVYFGEAATMFKFAKLNWDNNWGDDGADGTLDAGGADIAAEGPAMYRLHADLNENTYTATRTDWGLIGSATPDGWDADQDLSWDADAGVLTITLDLIAGAIKFRANDDWAMNLGDDQANGIMEYDGADIMVEADGNYTITLDLSDALYRYSVTKN